MRRKVKSRKIDQKVLEGYFPVSFIGEVTAEEVKALIGTLRITVEELVYELLNLAASRAITPLSGFKVGAICRGVSGNLYLGANIEFLDNCLQSTIHAEQAAVSYAITRGEKGLRAIYASEAPCGHCRQFMNELNSAHVLKVYIKDQEPALLSDLLPNAFGPSDLNSETKLMDNQDHPLVLLDGSSNDLEVFALKAAAKSYAPYSHCYSGVALKISNKQVFDGSYIENAAFNCSINPLQAAIVNLVMSGRKLHEIKEGVMVQTTGSKIDLKDITGKLFSTISKVPFQIIEAKEVHS